jgi:signal transduction histidine kinase
MVRRFISDMDGKLEVESVVGQGTTMHLYFTYAYGE